MTTLVAGGSGMVGAAILRRLVADGQRVLAPTRSELNLEDTLSVREYLRHHRVRTIYFCAARVGGILENSERQFEQYITNSKLQNAVFASSFELRVPRLIFLSSSCVYPAGIDQPIKESDLLSGNFEPTNEGYAAAKVGGMVAVKAARSISGLDWISVMPTSLYGPGDTYDPLRSHLIPAILLRMHSAKKTAIPRITNWGSGSPRREFLHVRDFADICTRIGRDYSDSEHINVGYGTDMSIREIADVIADTVGYTGTIEWDHSKPDGVRRKLLDSSKLHSLFDWQPTLDFRSGMVSQYLDFLRRFG